MVKDGFITWQGNKDFRASYGKNKNKTDRKFKSLREAKNYLIKNKVTEARYDSGRTYRKVNLKKITKRKRTNTPFSNLLRW